MNKKHLLSVRNVLHHCFKSKDLWIVLGNKSSHQFLNWLADHCMNDVQALECQDLGKNARDSKMVLRSFISWFIAKRLTPVSWDGIFQHKINNWSKIQRSTIYVVLKQCTSKVVTGVEVLRPLPYNFSCIYYMLCTSSCLPKYFWGSELLEPCEVERFFAERTPVHSSSQKSALFNFQVTNRSQTMFLLYANIVSW